MPVDLVLLCPGEHRVRRELGPVVRDDHSRLAAAVSSRPLCPCDLPIGLAPVLQGGYRQ